MSGLGRRRAVLAFAVLIVLVGLITWLPSRADLSNLNGFVVSSMVLIVIGELVLVMSHGRQSAPISTATAMGLALAPVGGSGLSLAQCLVAVAVAMTLGALLRAAVGMRTDVFELATRLIGVSVTAACARVEFFGTSLMDWWQQPSTPRWLGGLALIGAALVGVASDLILWSAGRARTLSVPWAALIHDDAIRFGAIGAVMTNAGALIALATPSLGAFAIPLFEWPMVLVLIGLRREERTAATHRQFVRALARLSDETGHTAKGHPRRVARVAVAIGEDLGLSPTELADLRDAALLHDLGQVTLAEPIPDGATVYAAPPAQSWVVQQSVALAAHAGARQPVLDAIAGSAAQFRQQREFGEAIPLVGRIIKVASAYDDLTHGRSKARGPALERIHLGLGYEYDPTVVDALSRVTQDPEPGVSGPLSPTTGPRPR
ncbi:putative lipoprotein [Nostocoides australiense Ben110]|uniref:Putative lipoprotein n=1 Tax=Nostocoides australiense Ben110 TaxID=1193182 RepID=W6JTR9_9MICO|nr:HD domain-containing phosphohydrolase [Tetrasphaera australiensis]MCB1302064.1 HD domain-containing protein [Tetrasphaera sp.]CCH71830.1 putative lipoprotein [Tetrasphaera australiensis Ben110]